MIDVYLDGRPTFSFECEEPDFINADVNESGDLSILVSSKCVAYFRQGTWTYYILKDPRNTSTVSTASGSYTITYKNPENS